MSDEPQTTNWICPGCGKPRDAHHACNSNDHDRHQAKLEREREKQEFLDSAALALMRVITPFPNTDNWVGAIWRHAEALWEERMKRYG